MFALAQHTISFCVLIVSPEGAGLGGEQLDQLETRGGGPQ